MTDDIDTVTSEKLSTIKRFPPGICLLCSRKVLTLLLLSHEAMTDPTATAPYSLTERLSFTGCNDHFVLLLRLTSLDQRLDQAEEGLVW